MKIKLIIVECRSGLVWVEKGGQRQGGEGSKGVNFGSPPFLYLTSSVIITDFELGLFIIKGWWETAESFPFWRNYAMITRSLVYNAFLRPAGRGRLIPGNARWCSQVRSMSQGFQVNEWRKHVFLVPQCSAVRLRISKSCFWACTCTLYLVYHEVEAGGNARGFKASE